MIPLPTPDAPSAILSFDFDGTLHTATENPPVPQAFFDILRTLREEQSILWGINTGRSIEHLIEGFTESRFPFLPDWIVAKEHEIHFSDQAGKWHPHAIWNQGCERAIDRLFTQARKLLLHLRKEIEEHTGARWLEMDGEPAGVISQSDEEMEWIVSQITPQVAAEPELSWQRNSIYLRFGHRDFQKGSSLSEIATLYGLPVERRFAIGDSHNDFEMLDPQHCGMIACPANAVLAIREKILSNGGLITQATHGHGAVEALHHYFGPLQIPAP